ncbi:LysR family substrate-binding domain-containing protein [Streptomyces sp. NBC_00582]|uniref:LysR family substrate-binding domain-containing protein n=1 Tax=Streptomyces sp. NBC_00582 TaxID=2975783 RepID=UPI002E820DFC|nr:LysR family substrate-binding domain-containing protein [Streptomyces sp. NBC_00582]WUB67909.1 LysR family substrate-binding domain-containing protein [Streptomyces sp. NBC_00582]
MTDALLAGDLDIGLCRALTPPHGLARTTLGHQPFNIAVAADHPLAARTSVSLSDLADQHFIVWGQPGHSGYTDLLIGHCRAAGFEPRTERTPLQGTPPVTAVIGTDRLAFVTTPPGPAPGGAVRIVALDPPLYAPLQARYSPRTTSPAKDAFLTTATLRPHARRPIPSLESPRAFSGTIRGSRHLRYRHRGSVTLPDGWGPSLGVLCVS